MVDVKADQKDHVTVRPMAGMMDAWRAELWARRSAESHIEVINVCWSFVYWMFGYSGNSVVENILIWPGPMGRLMMCISLWYDIVECEDALPSVTRWFCSKCNANKVLSQEQERCKEDT